MKILQKCFILSLVFFFLCPFQSVQAAKKQKNSSKNTEGSSETSSKSSHSPSSTLYGRSNEWTFSSKAFNQKKAKELKALIKKTDSVKAVAIALNGVLAYYEGDIKIQYPIRGCSHGIYGILAGIYFETDKLDLKKKISDFTSLKKVPYELPNATFEQLLSSRSGFFRPSANDVTALEKLGWKKGSLRPGECFVPNNWDMNMVEYILRNEFKRTFGSQFKKLIGDRIRMQEFQGRPGRSREPQKISKELMPEGLMISTRDLLRVGEMLRNNGVWDKHRIVPETWIQRMTTPLIDKKDPPEGAKEVYNKKLYSGYGLGWWILDGGEKDKDLAGAYSTGDQSGDFLTILPAAKIVIAVRSNTKKRLTPDEFRAILKAILACRR